MQRFPVILPRALLLVVVISLGIIMALFWGTDQALTPFYYATMCLLGWLAFQGGRGRASQAVLQAIGIPPLPRAILLGYAAVVVEETLVGTFFALNEGWTLDTWLRLVRQFISFNLLAFTGAILGLTLAVRLLPGLSRWHLLITGAWGVFAEGSYRLILSNPLGAILIAGPNIAVYSVILAPMVLSLPGHDRAGGPGRSLWAPCVAWGVILAFALPAVLLLGTLRQTYPDAFPPCAYISCDR